MAKKFQSLRGFSDLYPEDKASLNYLADKIRQICQSWGFAEFEGPILENFDIYKVKSGEELVSEQTFQFRDRRGRAVALRPELTPTLARMVVARGNQLILPLRWFSIGPFFRYEKPQAGRFRQFYQWNADLVGPKSAEADSEIIALIAQFFADLGVTSEQIVIKISDRKLLETRFEIIGIPKKNFSKILRIIDKKAKITKVEFENLLKRAGLGNTQIKDLGRILTDTDFSEESDNLTAIFANLQDLGVQQFCQFDPTVVRGLDYYTGTVFEVYDKAGKFRALAAGGRYDNLISDFGGPNVGSCGFGAGLEIIFNFLKSIGKLSEFGQTTTTKILVTIFDESLIRDSLKLVKFLREEGVPTELYPQIAKLDKQIKFAFKKGIPYMAILGPAEVERKAVTVKILATGEQLQVSQESLPNLVKTNFSFTT